MLFFIAGGKGNHFLVCFPHATISSLYDTLKSRTPSILMGIIFTHAIFLLDIKILQTFTRWVIINQTAFMAYTPNQTPEIISIQIKNGKLSAVFQKFYRTARLMRGFPPYRASKQ